MKKFLILGSNSFSGSHFCTYLIKQGHRVLATSRSNEPHDVFLPYKWGKFGKGKINFASLDLNHDQKKLLAILDDFKPTHIINFAAQSMVSQSWQSPRDWVKTNVDAITQVAHILKEYQFWGKLELRHIKILKNQWLNLQLTNSTSSTP